MPKIGVFDSGYGGLTVLRSLLDRLPQFDFVYLGDNARAPYGNRDFETVYQYTLQCVNWLFDQADCDLVILACNTASAKALRQIQQCDLPLRAFSKRLLGVIRPTTEQLGEYTRSGHVGILGTQGTIDSQSYPIELSKFYPELSVTQEACPLWVPLVEEDRMQEPEAHVLVQERLRAIMARDGQIDTLLLACTHYPLLLPLLERYTQPGTRLLSQGDLVAQRLEEYLNRHSAFAEQLDQRGELSFYTTGDCQQFRSRARVFFGREVEARSIHLPV